MPFIKPFKELGKNDAAIAGGKGASLGEMTRLFGGQAPAGNPIPPGFVVLSSAFEKFITETDIGVEIDSVMHTVRHGEIHTVDAASKKIKDLILKAEMPVAIAREIRASFKTLNSKFVAVRSSATAEDSASAAWAGQLESYLNTTEKDLLENVKKCWASLFTPRAIFYRFEKFGKETHLQKISVAVVVQKMVESEMSGIAFSVHPVTQDYNQLIIEAGLGLGEAIVSGQITPDSYVVEKVPRRILDKNVVTQTRGMFRKESGPNPTDGQANEWRDVPKEHGEPPALSDNQIFELSELILKIESHYGFPCDIEWAFEKGKFYIVQSRPITTLSNKQPEQPKQTFVKVYTRNFSIIMQQAWFAANKEGLTKKLDLKEYPYNPPYFYYMKDGVEEVWENTKANRWLLDKLIEKLESDNKFFPELYKRYFDQLLEIEKWWKKDIKTISELKTFVDKVYDGVSDFVVIYAALMDEGVPKEYQELAHKFREKDVFFAECNTAIWKALGNIYPDLGYLAVYITREELGKKIDKEELKKRDAGFTLIPGIFVGPISFDDLVSKFPEYKFEIEKGEQDENWLSGQSAYKGKVTGKVRIVKRRDQIDQVLKGEIMVSPMTTPDMLPAMKKAAAFVTDEGGITCHAAIIAREMRKPCIIGTKIATQILKDGMMVEVDADKGVVRILDKKDSKRPSQAGNDTISIGGDEWYLSVTRNMSAWHQFLSNEGHYHSNSEYGIPVPFRLLFLTVDGTHTHCFLIQQNNKEVATSIFDYLNSPRRIAKLKSDYEKYAKRLTSSLRLCLKQLTVKNWQKFTADYTRFTAGLYFTVVIGRGGADRLIEALKSRGYSDQEIPRIIATITYPAEHTPLFESQLDLLKIGRKIQQKKLARSKIKQALERWLKDYGMIPVNFCDEPWTIKDAETQLQNALTKDCTVEITRLEKEHNSRVKEAKIKLQEINDHKITLLAKIVAEGTYLNEFRKNVFSRVSLDYRPIFGKLAKRAGLKSWRDCFYLKPEEMEALVAGKGLRFGDIRKERRLFGAYVDKNGRRIDLDSRTLTGIENYVIAQVSGSPASTITDSVIKGFSASWGVVRGPAKIILSSRDFDKLNPGDILVTTMTSVDFVPIMEKAAAFVTNEGGITSHASIVAREMSKPCIIGTKIATQVIKDGDLIEVDADKGVVKILSTSQAESYTLHFRQTDFPFIFTDISFRKTNYGQLDYVLLQERDAVAGYLSEQGVRQAHDLGSKLLNKEFAGKILKKLQDLNFELKKDFAQVPAGTTTPKGLADQWKRIESMCDKVCGFYLYCEQPVQSALEESVAKACPSEDDLVKVLHDPTYAEKINFSELQKEHLHRMKEFGELKFSIHNALGVLFEDLMTFMQHLADRYGISIDQALSLRSGEIHRMLDRKIVPDRKVLEERVRGLVFLPYRGKDGTILVGKDYSFWKNKLEPKDITEVRGRVAFSGKAQGIVKIHLSLIAGADIPPGTVLISGMTNPQIVPYLKNAVAIVTDEGGLTCHAAIISRELKIPCVVGTQIATQVFKDGDLVEVDADKGVVRILNK